MKRLLLAISLLLISTTTFANELAEVEGKIRQLNDDSLSSLGITVNALSLLLVTHPQSYLPAKHIVSRTRISIHELEDKGYITVLEVMGLPDGYQPQEKFLRLIPTDKGKVIQQF